MKYDGKPLKEIDIDEEYNKFFGQKNQTQFEEVRNVFKVD